MDVYAEARWEDDGAPAAPEHRPAYAPDHCSDPGTESRWEDDGGRPVE